MLERGSAKDRSSATVKQPMGKSPRGSAGFLAHFVACCEVWSQFVRVQDLFALLKEIVVDVSQAEFANVAVR